MSIWLQPEIIYRGPITQSTVPENPYKGDLYYTDGEVCMYGMMIDSGTVMLYNGEFWDVLDVVVDSTQYVNPCIISSETIDSLVGDSRF